MIREMLARSLAHSVSGDPWHGPSLEKLLADVDGERAAEHPVPGAHSILELVLHLGAWTGEVAARLRGRPPMDPEIGDWPEARTWDEARDRLTLSLASLLDALAEAPESRLLEKVPGERQPALGTGLTYGQMLIGVAEHHAYHGGQIAILKKALAAAKS